MEELIAVDQLDDRAAAAEERLRLSDDGLQKIGQIELQRHQHRLQIDDLLQPQRRVIDGALGKALGAHHYRFPFDPERRETSRPLTAQK